MAPKPRKPLGFWVSSFWLGLCGVSAVFGDFFPLPRWNDYDYEALGFPLFSPGHILGTDFDGTDVLSGLIHGARTSLGMATTAVVLGSLIGGVLGVVAAYRRGWVDSVVTMFFNVMLSIPTLVLTLVLVAILSSPTIDDSSAQLPREMIITIALTLVLIPILGRIARASALTWTGRDFVLVAE